MCRDCWANADGPTDWTPNTAHLLNLISDLYAIHAAGGPLHTALDDWNLNGTISPDYEPYEDAELDALYYQGWPLAELDPAAPAVVEGLGRSMRSLCEEIAALLNAMTEPQRVATMAYHDGFTTRPA